MLYLTLRPISALPCQIMHQSIPSTNIPPGNFFKVVKFPAPRAENFLRNTAPGQKSRQNPAPGDNFVDLQDNFAMIVKPFAFFWYSSLAWLSSSFFKDYKACEYKIGNTGNTVISLSENLVTLGKGS